MLACSPIGGITETDWGWDPNDVLTFQVSLPESGYGDDAAVAQFYDRLRADLRSIPGVAAVGGNEILPLQGESTTYYNVVGQEVPRNDRWVISARVAQPGYFETMGITVLKGRPIAESDRPDSPPVIVINEELAKRHWASADEAIGQKLDFWGEQQEIVGVVRNTLEFAREARPMGFIPAGQLPLRTMSMVVRSRQAPAALAGAVRRTVSRLDPALPAYRIAPMAELMHEKNGLYWVMPRVMAGLAAIALLLGLLGVYGVISRSVSQRRQEVGIRMALGATQGGVLSLLMRQGLMLVAVGSLLGIGLSAVVTRNLQPFLFGVSPWEGPTLAAVTLVLMATGVLASFVPARRATAVSPVRALRDD
jgi:putative ABC transport system permease protein